MVGNAENILVEYDYQNIIVVDPNKIVDTEGNVKERQVKHENLVFYASLECQLLPRTRLAVGANNLAEVQNLTISSINFLAPAGEQFLKNDFYDEFTGEKNERGELKYNQSESSVQRDDKTTEYYIKQSTKNNYDTGLLGMKSINISINSAGFSEVAIELEDVRGRALFEKGEESPYAAFFNLPYPIFYLTVKGYFGQAVKYQLSLLTFNTEFDTQTGNYKISTKFIAYKYNVLTSINMAHVLATPYMYNVNYNLVPNPTNPPQQTNGTKNVEQISTSKGYGKIKEVYSEYKSKRLVDEDLPELTLRQLVTRLERLEKFFLESYGQQSLTPVTDADNYREALQNYDGEVYYFGGSWFNTYLDKSKVFVDNKKNKLYTFNKETIDKNQQEIAISDLKTKIDTNNAILKNNGTFGENGSYTVSNKTEPSSIPVDITYNDIYYTDFSTGNINWRESFILQNGKEPTPQETLDFTNANSGFTNSVSKQDGQIKYDWFTFDGDGKFLSKTSKISNTLTTLTEKIDSELSNALAQQIQTKDNGLGFRPTIRNICGILMANTEAFLRLFNDTHKKAWDARDSQEKRNAVLGQTTVTNPDDIAGDPIYPWPQFFVQTNKEKGEIYELQYPGDIKYINATKGYLYEIWPEVEFVEEYLKGLTQTTQTQLDPGPQASDTKVVNRVTLNSLEYFPGNIIFENKEEVKFFYEIYERVLLAPFFQRLNKKFVLDSQLSQVVSESEKINMINALGVSSPYLVSKIKQYGLGAAGYTNFLRSISNDGTGESWQKFIRDEFVTSYIQSNVDRSFELFLPSTSSAKQEVQPQPKNFAKVNDFLGSTQTNETDITDTFPFTIPNWFKTNLADGNSSNQKDIYNTTKVLKYNQTFKMFANFESENSTQVCRPVTSFNFYNTTKPTINQALEFKNFYTNRKITDFLPTEGYVYYNDYLGGGAQKQTTSIFNTPYFHNAISEGVFNLKNNIKNPFVPAAYLFLNSLPLATLREKYKTLDGNNTIDLDYIFASLKKFGSVQKVPYAWILKYGSIWHRYKKYTSEGFDILDNVWTNFDYKYFYDPITSNPQKQYTITAGTTTDVITLQNLTNVSGSDILEINLGFYPLLINNYNYLLKGEDLFTLYNNDELSQNLTSGYTLNVCNDAIINKPVGYNPNSLNESLRITPWIVTLKDLPNKSTYVIPSFGSNVNQLEVELFKNNQLVVDPFENTSMYNGSIRGFLAASNFGFFDNNQIDRPNPDKYIKDIFSAQSQQEAISFNKQSGYVNIEEILGVFNKNIMDRFEREFLNFCQSMYSYNPESTIVESSTNINNSQITTDISPSFKNFQMLMKELLKIPETNISGSNTKQFINNVSQNQFTNVINVIQKFMEFDCTFKYGNPSDYNRRLFDSFSSTITISDKISFPPYTPGTLPGDGTTVSLSEQIYPDGWKALKLFVGNPKIQNLEYVDTGSTITDFFIDNDIEFSPQSIATLAPLIKIYATQKDIVNPYNSNTFTQNINEFLQSGQEVQNQILNSLLQAVRTDLPNYSEVPEKVVNSAVSGSQSKLELWETFKAFNDTWIAGTDYSQTLLFEDILFLDRGNRDIGDEIIVDPFKIKNYLSNINISASTYSYLMTILETHHFVTMMLPSYVNYYNVIDGTDGTQAFVDSTSEFGNNLFGNYLTVDTRKSSPKMVARYAEPGSKYLSSDPNKNKNMRFKSDSMDLVKASDCPLIDKLDGKTDWTKSNRVVGFNVDIGIRNQNVFKNFSVSQELGKQTTESLMALDSAVNQSSGRNSTTQNVSLYNFYKNRSYKCTVQSMGNAMIQPTMYFNLRHVPMFTGPYLIQSVKHNISSGGFNTTFEGIRQSILSLPKVTDYMQTITKEILESLKSKRRQANNNLQKTNQTPNNISQVSKGYTTNTQELSQSQTACSTSLLPKYETYIRLNGKAATFNQSNNFEVSLSPLEMVAELKQFVTSDKNKYFTFTLSYLESYNDTRFVTYNNNFAGVKLNRDYGGSKTFFTNYYSCQNNSDGTSQPYAVFEDTKFFQFMNSYLDKKITNYSNDVDGFLDFYYNKWSNTDASAQSFEQFKTTTEYQTLKSSVEQSFILAKNTGL